MKILLTHFYSRHNKGDAAITSSMLHLLSNKFPKSKIIISSMDKTDDEKAFEGYNLISSFFYESIYKYRNKLLKILNLLTLIPIIMIWGAIFRLTKLNLKFILPKRIKCLIDNYISADLVIGVGGGYLIGKNTVKDTITIVIHCFQIYFAKLLNKPVILYSQSIGSFGNKFQEFVVSYSLKKVDLIIVRERISLSILKNLNIPYHKIKLSVDAAFNFKGKKNRIISNFIRKFKLRSKSKSVGFTVKKCLQYDDQLKYEKEIGIFADYLIFRGYNVTFIPQVTSKLHNDDDRIVINRIIKKMNFQNKVYFFNNDLNHFEIKSIYDELDYLIGTRMHSVIFALTGYVPTIALMYENKTMGIMQDLDLEKWIIPVEKVTFPILKKMFKKLNKNENKFRIILRNKLPNYINESKNTINYISNLLNNSYKHSIN